jgi:hypothetical protein
MSAAHARLTRLTPLVAVAVIAAGAALVVRGHDPGVAAASPVTPGTVTVSGVGTVQGVPDTLTASFDVHARRSTVQGALNGSSRSTGKVIAALRKDGVSGGDIQTTDLSVDTDYGEHDQVIGYIADETLSASLHPLARVGKILGDATGAAGNHVEIDDLSFDIAHDAALLEAAQTKAFADAKAAAQKDAWLSGRQLGAVISVKQTTARSEDPGDTEAFSTASGLAAGAPVPIRAGRQPVSVTVSVIWSLE